MQSFQTGYLVPYLLAVKSCCTQQYDQHDPRVIHVNCSILKAPIESVTRILITGVLILMYSSFFFTVLHWWGQQSMSNVFEGFNLQMQKAYSFLDSDFTQTGTQS